MAQVNTTQATAVSDEVSLKDLILKLQRWNKFLLSKWLIILIAVLVGGALGITYSLLKKSVYTAQLSFALEDEKQGGMGSLGAAAGLASQFGIDLGGSGRDGAFSGDNLLELMKSRSMVESTLLTPVTVDGKQKTLAELYIDFNKYREQWGDKPDLGNMKFLPGADRSKFTLKQDSVLGLFYKDIIKSNLAVDKIDKKLSIITVKLISKNEIFSKYFVEVLTKTVSDFYIDTKTKKSVQNVNILQRQTDSVRRELNSAITGVASSVDVNPNPNPALQILRVPSQRRQVDVQANQAILTQLVANLELSKISLRKETPLIQIIDKPILPLQRERPGKLFSFLVGAILAGLFSIFYISLKRFYYNLMNG